MGITWEDYCRNWSKRKTKTTQKWEQALLYRIALYKGVTELLVETHDNVLALAQLKGNEDDEPVESFMNDYSALEELQNNLRIGLFVSHDIERPTIEERAERTARCVSEEILEEALNDTA